MDVDFLIVGQGLAGSALAVELIKRRQRVMVVDRGDEASSSRVAAGLITPITGKGMNPAWRQDEYLPAAVQFYRELEQGTGSALYHETEVLRLLGSEKELEKWRRKAAVHSRWGQEVSLDQAGIDARHGAVSMAEGGWLDTRAFLTAVQSMLTAMHAFRSDDFKQGDVSLRPEGIAWRDVMARRVILCQGAYGLGKQGWFGSLPHRSAKGEILTLECNHLAADRRYHANGWLAPRGSGVWIAGATYDWKNLDTEPTESGRTEVLEKLKSWCDLPMKLLAHRAGVRPIIRNSRPVAGLHPEHSQVGFFNGLGSKGSLMAPAVAAHFADFLTNCCALDPELAIPLPTTGKPEKQTVPNLLKMAHEVMKRQVQQGDTVIDATVGNGHDTLYLTSLVGKAGKVIGFDIQRPALHATRQRLDRAGAEATLLHRSHSEMVEALGEKMLGEVAAIVFNLGYLPGADKSLITQVESTLEAVRQASELLKPGGVLTVMCYPGHAGGDLEAEEVRRWVYSLSSDDFQVSHYQRENHRSSTPFLLVAVKKKTARHPGQMTGGGEGVI